MERKEEIKKGDNKRNRDTKEREKEKEGNRNKWR